MKQIIECMLSYSTTLLQKWACRLQSAHVMKPHV